MHQLTSSPALRLAIPLIAGILMAGNVSDSSRSLAYPVALCVASGVPLSVCVLRGRGPDRLFGPMLFCFFFATGAALAIDRSDRMHPDWPDSARTYRAVVAGSPVDKPKSLCLPLHLLSSDGNAGNGVYLYVPRNGASARIAPGDVIMFRGRISPPDNTGLDFDYASFLERKGVCGTLWVDSLSWAGTGAVCGGLLMKGQAFRRKMADAYRLWGFTDDVLAVVAAVSLGDRQMLSEEVRRTYSESGASHVLAVSGLHVGIIYAFLSFLFPAFMNVSWRRCVREILIMVLLWGYAIMIGMPLSITRSLIMFTAIAVCRCAGRDSSSLNSLAVAAIVILLCNPSGVRDPGFQLSFLAVLSILLFQPVLSGLWKPAGTVTGYIWGIISVSIAAQIGTAPAVAYHFSTFSTYFLLTNIVAIPLMFVIVSLVVSLWLVFWIVPLRTMLVSIVSMLVRLVDFLLGRIVALPESSLDVGSDNVLPVWLTYLTILLLYGYLSRKSSRCLVAAVAVPAVSSAVMLMLAL